MAPTLGNKQEIFITALADPGEWGKGLQGGGAGILVAPPHILMSQNKTQTIIYPAQIPVMDFK